MSSSEEKIAEPGRQEKARYPMYDDETLERMQEYYRLASYDELLRYIKRYGVHRHFDVFES